MVIPGGPYYQLMRLIFTTDDSAEVSFENYKE